MELIWYSIIMMMKIFDQKKISLHRPGIEPESREWESRMITITPTVPATNVRDQILCLLIVLFKQMSNSISRLSYLFFASRSKLCQILARAHGTVLRKICTFSYLYSN